MKLGLKRRGYHNQSNVITEATMAGYHSIFMFCVIPTFAGQSVSSVARHAFTLALVVTPCLGPITVVVAVTEYWIGGTHVFMVRIVEHLLILMGCVNQLRKTV